MFSLTRPDVLSLPKRGAAWLSLVLLLLATLALAPARAGAEAAARVRLVGRNVFSSSEPGSIRVRVPRDVWIPTNRRANGLKASPVSLTGDGSFAGMALLEDPYPGYRRPHHALVAGRFTGCWDVECQRSASVNYLHPSPGDGKPYRIRAGNYRLFLLTDGSPVTVTLTLPGLDRSRRLPLEPFDGLDVQQIPIENSAPNTWSGGSSFRSGSLGFSLSALFLHADQYAGGTANVCQYSAPSAPPEEVAYGPQCSAATSRTGAGGTSTLPDEGSGTLVMIQSFGYTESSGFNQTGERGLGFWVDSPAPLDATAVGFFLDLSAQ